MIREDFQNLYTAIIFNLEEFQTYIFSHNLNSEDLGYFLYSNEDSLGVNVPEYFVKNNTQYGYKIVFKDLNNIELITYTLGTNKGSAKLEIFKIDY